MQRVASAGDPGNIAVHPYTTVYNSTSPYCILWDLHNRCQTALETKTHTYIIHICRHYKLMHFIKHPLALWFWCLQRDWSFPWQAAMAALPPPPCPHYTGHLRCCGEPSLWQRPTTCTPYLLHSWLSPKWPGEHKIRKHSTNKTTAHHHPIKTNDIDICT